MKKHIIATDSAPEAVGPYSQAMRVGGLIYTSGQIPLNLDGDVVEGGLEEQTEQVFQNLISVLKAAEADLSDVIKATVYLKDLSQFTQFNTIYAKYFGDHKPARTTVEVSRLPKDVLVEIDLIAAVYVE